MRDSLNRILGGSISDEAWAQSQMDIKEGGLDLCSGVTVPGLTVCPMLTFTPNMSKALAH